jgi:hypothetical protein
MLSQVGRSLAIWDITTFNGIGEMAKSPWSDPVSTFESARETRDMHVTKFCRYRFHLLTSGKKRFGLTHAKRFHPRDGGQARIVPGSSDPGVCEKRHMPWLELRPNNGRRQPTPPSF